MSETKLCSVCNNEMHQVYYGNEHTTFRCMKCENKHVVSHKFGENDSEIDK